MSSARNRRVVVLVVGGMTLAMGGAIALVGRSVQQASWRVPVERVSLKATTGGQVLPLQADGRARVCWGPKCRATEPLPSGWRLSLHLDADRARYPFVALALGDALDVRSWDAAGIQGDIELAPHPDGWTVHLAPAVEVTTFTLIASNRRLNNALVAAVLDGEDPTDLSDRGAVAGELSIAWPEPEPATGAAKPTTRAP